MRIELRDGATPHATPRVVWTDDALQVYGSFRPAYDLPSQDVLFSEVVVRRRPDDAEQAWMDKLGFSAFSDLMQRGGPQHGENQLTIEIGGNELTVRWSDLLQLPPSVRALVGTLRGFAADLPDKQWEDEILDRCRTMAEQLYGPNIQRWIPVVRTEETFDAYLDSAAASRDPVLAGVRIPGCRVVLRCDDDFVAFHIGDRRIVVAETWSRGQLPAYPPSLVDLAHARRQAGMLDGALMLFRRAAAASQGCDLAVQCSIEAAEILGATGQTAEALAVLDGLAPVAARREDVREVVSLTQEWIQNGTALRAGAGHPPSKTLLRKRKLDWWRRPQLSSGVPDFAKGSGKARSSSSLQNRPAAAPKSGKRQKNRAKSAAQPSPRPKLKAKERRALARLENRQRRIIRTVH